MTKTNLFAIVAGVAIVLGLVFAPVAKAQTTDATIASLLAQIQALTAQLNALKGGSTPATTGYVFTRDLTVGSQGADVTALQNKLGVVPATGYFGAITKAAVQAYQAEKGISATGYVGSLTRAALNAAASTGGTTTGGTTTGGTTTTPSTTGAEGQLTTIESIGGITSTVREGETSKKVLGAQVKAEDSDMTINRVDVDFTVGTTAGASSRLSRYIETASIMLDGKKLATKDAADITKENGVYSFRFSGLDGVVKEGKTAKLYVVVDAVSNIDSSDTTNSITVNIPANGIRAVDTAGISDTYVTSSESTSLTESFKVQSAQTGDVSLTSTASENEDRVVTVKQDNDISGVEVMRFSLKSKTSDNLVNSLKVVLATTTATSTTLATVIDNVALYANGDEIDSQSIAAGQGSKTLTFDNLDLNIAEDETIDFVVKADINSQKGNYGEGYSFQASVAGSDMDVEDSAGDTVTVSGGTRTGGDIQLRIQGISASLVSADTAVRTGTIAGNADYFDGTIVFKVTNNGDEDIWVDGEVVATASPDTLTDGLAWATTTQSNTGTSTSVTPVLSASGDTSNDANSNFYIAAGSSRTFTFKVSIPTGISAGNLGVRITGIKWDTDNGDATANLYTFNLDDFKTNTVTGLTIH